MIQPLTPRQEDANAIDAALDKMVLHDYSKEGTSLNIATWLIVSAALDTRGMAAITLGYDVYFKKMPKPGEDLPLVGHEAFHVLRAHLMGIDAWQLAYIKEVLKGTPYMQIWEEKLAYDVQRLIIVILMGPRLIIPPMF